MLDLTLVKNEGQAEGRGVYIEKRWDVYKACDGCTEDLGPPFNQPIINQPTNQPNRKTSYANT